MLTRIVNTFWPDMDKEEVKKFSILGGMFFLIIGSYWLLRLLKNTLLYKIAFPEALGWPADYGRLMQPVAKFWSPFIIIGLVLLYSKLVDLFEKHRLFYLLISIYTLLFGCITIMLGIRHFMGDAFLGKSVLAALGWISYFTIESFGSLIAALFWSFTASITTTDSAKRGYPLIAALAQLGAIFGSAPTLGIAQLGGIWVLFLGATLAVGSTIFVMHYFMRTMPPQALIGNRKAHDSEKKKEGFIEGFTSGLVLLFTKPYLIAVLIVSTFYEVITQIIEYQMQSNACIYPAYCTEAGFAQFQGIYGICVNILAFSMALLGTSYLIKRYGLRFCLLFFPICLGIAFISLFAFFIVGSPDAGQLLWATFAVMIIAKGLGYAVNNPVKEIMYIPTSKDVKFKSKGWIDMFGSRTAKQGGAQVTNAFKHSIPELMMYGTIFSLGLTAVWIMAAIFVGNKNKQLIKDNQIIQ